MPMFNIIPAIDLLDGKVVRLTKGDYRQVQHYEVTPADIAKAYEDAGANRIHVVDLDGAKEGRRINADAISAIRKAVSVEIELGGGIRHASDADAVFDIGINFVILGSLLINDFETAKTIINTYPKQIIAGIDAKDDYVATDGWITGSQTHIDTLLADLADLPISAVIYTDISKDGTLQGPNLERLKHLDSNSPKPIIASGGVANVQDIRNIEALAKTRIEGVIVGKAILNGHIDLNDLWS